MHGFLLWLTICINLLLAMVFASSLFLGRKHRTKLRKECDVLLQEKEATLGFVHNVGEVFVDAESVDMDSLLTRVLHYAVRTCKAGSGAIHIVNAKSSQLEARAVSGIFPPPFNTAAARIELERGATGSLEKMVRDMPVPFGKGLIGEAAVLGNSVLVEDADIDSRIPQLQAEFL